MNETNVQSLSFSVRIQFIHQVLPRLVPSAQPQFGEDIVQCLQEILKEW